MRDKDPPAYPRVSKCHKVGRIAQVRPMGASVKNCSTAILAEILQDFDGNFNSRPVAGTTDLLQRGYEARLKTSLRATWVLALSRQKSSKRWLNRMVRKLRGKAVGSNIDIRQFDRFGHVLKIGSWRKFPRVRSAI